MNKSTLSLLALTAAVLCALTAMRAHAASADPTIADTRTVHRLSPQTGRIGVVRADAPG